MKKTFWGWFLIVVVPQSFLHADIAALSEKMSVTQGIENWNAQIAFKTLENAELRKMGLMECAEVAELEGVILCAANKKRYMNKALSRASIFSEGTQGIEAGNLTETSSAAYLKIEKMAVGHDIPSQELLNFWTKLESSCAQKRLCPAEEEEELFKKVVLPASQKLSQFVVISYSLDTDWWVTLTHEMMHAQYFLDPIYRQTVDQFWNESVTDQDRKKIKSILGSFYNGNDEFVMRNEFQAYLLQKNPEQYELHAYVTVYRDKLIKSLREAGAAPIAIK